MPDMNTPNAKGKTIMDYLPMAAQKLMGQGRPQEGELDAKAPQPMKQAIDSKVLNETVQTLKDYKAPFFAW